MSGLLGKKVVHAAGGYSFSVAVTDDGEVYAWGFNDKFQVKKKGRKFLEIKRIFGERFFLSDDQITLDAFYCQVDDFHPFNSQALMFI